MEPIVLETALNPTDWDALQRHIQRRVWRDTAYTSRLVNALLWGTGAGLLLYGLSFATELMPFAGVAAFLLVIGFCWWMLLRRARAVYRPKAGSSILFPTRFEIDSAGIRTNREHQWGGVDWLAVESIDETADHVFLQLDRTIAFVIPKRQIVSITPGAFVAQVRQWHAERRGQSAAASPASPAAASPVGAPTHTALTSDGVPLASVSSAPGGTIPSHTAPSDDTPPQPRGFWPDLRSNLLAGLRVITFRRVQPANIVASFDQVAALLVTFIAVVVILDRATAGVDVEFNTYGVYTWVTLLFMGVSVCALVARSINERADTRTLLVVVLATAPWALIVTTLLGLIPAGHDTWYVYAVIAIVLCSLFLAIRGAYGAVPRASRMVIAVSLLIFASLQDYLYFDTHLWTELSDDDESLEKPTAGEAEQIFFDQQARIDEEVDKLAPQRPGVTDLYYIGFGGDGYQRVFRRETLLGQRVFADRLGTGPRSLELINDYQDRESFPLATPVSLRYALSETGRVMDPNEDVLVLLLTSHGSREGGIYVRNAVSLIDTDLPPTDLRSALDDAGIKWRIVIVSACYSGVFIEPLKSENTAIITAADSTHTSFGCADDRDLTYFGEAFLQGALPKAPTLQAAFESAREDIAERETAEKLSPSNPQMWVGASMAKKLAALGRFPLPRPVALQTNE